ncbi:MAG TPA: hypothetical protein PLN02_10825 [Azonexus sp.]|nr:hypothetical protein [Azonexus sp.]
MEPSDLAYATVAKQSFFRPFIRHIDMPYRPSSEHRKIPSVIVHLTAAIHRVYGSRAQDQARPIGAFYPQHVKKDKWEHLGGIWYRAYNEQEILCRNLNAEVVTAFVQSIRTGENARLANGRVITWEQIPSPEASLLPPPFPQSNPA